MAWGRSGARGAPVDEAPPERVIAELGAEVARLSAEVERLRAELALRAVREPATGLFNARETRRLVRLEIDRCRRHRRPFSLLLVRLAEPSARDRAIGLEGWDQLLRRVATTCARDRRSVDVVGHLDAERVLVMLPETPAASAGVVAERIRRLVEADPSTVEGPAGQRVSVQARIELRIVAFPDDGADLDDLLRSAGR